MNAHFDTKISPASAERLVLQDIIPHFQIIALDQNDYLTVLNILATNNIEGGATYYFERNIGYTFPPRMSFRRNLFTRWRYCRVFKKIPSE